MNILASYTWIRAYLKTDATVEDFIKHMTAAGNSVERIEYLRDRFKHIVVGIVQSVDTHPHADKLRVAMVDIGTAVVQIVCGGTNVKKKQCVAVALPGSSVRWHGKGEPIILQETEIRGLKSHGMICAPEELGFEITLEGERPIWDLTKITKAEPGTPLAEALDIDDCIMDIEVTSNRPDCMGIVGQAREGFAAVGGKFSWKPKKLQPLPTRSSQPKADQPLAEKGEDALKIRVEAPDLALKYETVVMDGVKVGPSPWWLQKKLLLAGHKPVNNVVDVTNFVLLELGHPLHAFDAAALAGESIVVRRAKMGEQIEALDGKTYALKSDMLVIADAEKPAAIAGIIGGMRTGTNAGTTRIVIESAAFHPANIRQTARALTMQTDASLLFEKGLSTQATSPALARAVELIKKVAGGRVASNVSTFDATPYQAPMFSFDPKKAAALMGVDIPAKDQVALLKRLGFALKKNGKTFDVSVPYWRDHDIENSRDFVEEIARLFGYANIPAILPVGEPYAVSPHPILVWERRAKESLRAAGLTESYNFSFVSAKQLERYGIALSAAVKIANPLSSDQEYMRPSLIPTLLTAVESNQRRQPQSELFELAPVYEPNGADIPEQKMRLTLALSGVDGEEGFRRARGVLERLLQDMGIRGFRLERLASGTDDARWHRMRSAAIWIGQHDHVGMIGHISSATASAFGIEQPTFLVELFFDKVVEHATSAVSYRPIPAFQEVKRDLAIVVDRKTAYTDVEHALKAASGLLEAVELFDVYRGMGVPEGKKSLAMHLSFRAANRTLSAVEIETELGKAQDALKEKFDAILRV